jgi:hypothetical protein
MPDAFSTSIWCPLYTLPKSINLMLPSVTVDRAREADPARSIGSSTRLIHLPVIVAQRAETASLEIHHIDERYEANTPRVEIVIAFVIRCLAETIEEFRSRSVGHAVLAGDRVHLAHAQPFAPAALEPVAFSELGELGFA